MVTDVSYLWHVVQHQTPDAGGSRRVLIVSELERSFIVTPVGRFLRKGKGKH